MATLPVVFIGNVVAGGVGSIREDPWFSSSRSVRFEVIEVFRGLAPGTKFVDMETMPTLGMCSPNPYRPGRTYLVTPGVREGRFFDGSCFSGRDVEDAKDSVEFLRRHFRNPSRFHIRGRVGAAEREDFDLDEDKPLSGAVVSTVAGGRVISSTTDAQGRYELAVPTPGQYLVQSRLNGYRNTSATVRLRNAPCANHTVAMVSGSSISGKVVDANGQLVRHAQVGLFALDGPSTADSVRAWYRTEFPDRSDGRFRFENVPLGRYILAVNPMGPRIDGYDPFPFESTYHPTGSDRANAKNIEIDRGGLQLTGKDIVAGAPVDFRNVTLKYRFADGAPITSAVVDVIGDASPGGVQWSDGQSIYRGQSEVRFRVPANRTIRMSLRDRYGRDLGKRYESTHAPGTAPIFQEFIVEH